MNRKCLLLMLTALIANTPIVVRATSETEALQELSIMNLSVNVPDVWEYQDVDVDEETTLYTYQTQTEYLFIYDTHYQDEYDEDVAGMYDALVGAVAYGYQDNDGYILISEDKYEIDGALAQNDFFICKTNGVSYCYKIASVNTGYSVVNFIYTRYLGDEGIGIDGYDKMVSSIRIGDSIMNPKEEYTKYTTDNNKVGTDIPAGEYILFAENNHGYFCVSPDSNQNDITFNDNFDYNSIITVNNGEYLKLSHCYAIPIEEDPELSLTGTGMFKVGFHIPAGEYKLEATDGNGYYCIYPDSRRDHILANDIFEGQNYVTVSDGQYLVLNGCKFVNPPEKPIKTYTDADTIKKVQEALNAAGYDCGAPDGIAGSGTKAAIEKYQTDKSLRVTGTITEELLKSLCI